MDEEGINCVHGCDTVEFTDGVTDLKRHPEKYYTHPTEISSFQHTSIGTVFIIRPASNGSSVINCFRHKELKFVDVTGTVLKKETINFVTLGFTWISNDERLFTNIHEKCVMRMLTSGPSTMAFSTAPLIPVQICVTEENCLLVTLVDNTEYDVTSENTRVLTKYTYSGLRMITVERDNHGHRLFCRPGRVKYNRLNGLTVVGNRTGETTCHIVVFDKDLRLLFRYLGNGRTIYSDDEFETDLINASYFPVDVDFDPQNNIVVADNHQKSLELLDCLGQLLRIILQEASPPRSLSVHFDGTLWIGFTNGQVKVYKYLELRNHSSSEERPGNEETKI